MNWHDWFVYDEASPSCLTNKVRRGRVPEGAVSGWKNTDGYWCVQLAGRAYLVHRVVYEMHHGVLASDYEVDHEDGNTSNTKINNLRAVTHAVNLRNMRRSKRNTSDVTGVSRVTKTNKHGKSHIYWTAHWMDGDGCRCSVNFSVTKLGEAAAKQAAILARTGAIAELNINGLDYSERHGTCSTQN